MVVPGNGNFKAMSSSLQCESHIKNFFFEYARTYTRIYVRIDVKFSCHKLAISSEQKLVFE
jgi:hypothetical protein